MILRLELNIALSPSPELSRARLAEGIRALQASIEAISQTTKPIPAQPLVVALEQDRRGHPIGSWRVVEHQTRSERRRGQREAHGASESD